MFDVGQKVIVVNKHGNHWDNEGFMDEHMGRIVTIRKVHSIGYMWNSSVGYNIKEDGGMFGWKKEDFIPLNDCIYTDDDIRR